MANEQIQQLEMQIFELTQQLNALRKDQRGPQVQNYEFTTLTGKVSLLDLFVGKSKLLAIHNMGQACRYCTLWADGINPFIPHLESVMSVVLLSKDTPDVQRRFANSRDWRFRTASHGGGDYIKEQTVMQGADNMPGVVIYEREDDTIYRKSAGIFGPGDQYCTMWNLLGLAGMSEADWTPQYNYWTRPAKLEDGGENIIE